MTVWILTVLMYCQDSDPDVFSETYYTYDAGAEVYYTINDGAWDSESCVYLDPVLKEVLEFDGKGE